VAAARQVGRPRALARPGYYGRVYANGHAGAADLTGTGTGTGAGARTQGADLSATDDLDPGLLDPGLAVLEEVALEVEASLIGDPLGDLDMAAQDVEPSDGRAARSHRTRRAIIDAMRELHAEGDLRPTALRIAERAGVSLRTIWQQFPDREALLVEALRRDREILRSMVRKIDPDQPLAARVEAFISQRARICEEMTPTWRAARYQTPFSDQLRRNRGKKTAGGRVELERLFDAELSQLEPGQRQQLTDGLHAITIWAFWESLRTDLGLRPDQARDLLRSTFTALLAQAGFR
jgi:TetR/AcrR family transcriptional regulator, regulator of autoinduction and epiphytic fitness